MTDKTEILAQAEMLENEIVQFAMKNGYSSDVFIIAIVKIMLHACRANNGLMKIFKNQLKEAENVH